MNLICRVVALCLLAVGLIQPLARADDSTIQGSTWTLKLSQGWRAMPQMQLDNINRAAAQSGSTYQYTHGMLFFNAAGDPMAYALVQYIPDNSLAGASWEEVERGMTKKNVEKGADEAKQKLGSTLTDYNVGTPTLDRASKSFTIEFDLTGPDGQLHGLSRGFLGVGGTYDIHCYATKESFESVRADINSMLSGFAYNPGQAFTPGPGHGSGGIDWGRVAIMGVVGGVVAVVISAAKKATGK